MLDSLSCVVIYFHWAGYFQLDKKKRLSILPTLPLRFIMAVSLVIPTLNTTSVLCTDLVLHKLPHDVELIKLLVDDLDLELEHLLGWC